MKQFARYALARTALILVLIVVSGSAWALGLGQLRVKSQPGQPLVAEIPVISNDPAELENLQARLASPDTFLRVGLQPPGTEVQGLQFSVALDDSGKPVIRVTSAIPLQQPQLTFLLEVDWGDGRLVREYSALVDVPRTVAAPIQPVQAPTVAPSNTIVRAPTITADSAEPAEAAQAGEPAAPSSQASPPPASAIAPTAPARSQAASRPRVPTLSPSGDYRVVTGDTLSQIAVGLGQSGKSLNQTMLALLRANPEAFIGDNINLVKAGAVLRMPSDEMLSQYSKGEAAALVRTQIAQWRQMQSPQRQPGAVAQNAADRADSGNAGNRQSDNGKAAPTKTDARLEIVPPSSGDGQRAGTRSGITAGGEGDMERQELQQTKETLAARDAEVSELKSRVVELEKLQNQQQQLIQLKDSSLAAAQQDLAKSNTTQTQTQQPAKTDDGGAGFWLWGGLLLLVAALVAWLLMRGRRDNVPVRRRFDTGDFAPNDLAESAFPRTTSSADLVQDSSSHASVEDTASEGAPALDDADLREAVVDPPAAPPHWTSAPALVGSAPAWHEADSTMDQGQGSDVEKTEWDDAGESPERQIELARAYLDLGDDDAARALLLEVLDGRDPGSRETAARLLRDL